jgi:hypothetical protein
MLRVFFFDGLPALRLPAHIPNLVPTVMDGLRNATELQVQLPRGVNFHVWKGEHTLFSCCHYLRLTEQAVVLALAPTQRD